MTTKTLAGPKIKTALPGPNAKRVLSGDEKYISPSYTRSYPLVAKQGPDCRTAQLFAKVAKCLHEASPDVLVIYTDDHFNTFFLDNFPTFAIGIADQISGPNDQTAMPSYRVAGEPSLVTR